MNLYIYIHIAWQSGENVKRTNEECCVKQEYLY